MAKPVVPVGVEVYQREGGPFAGELFSSHIRDIIVSGLVTGKIDNAMAYIVTADRVLQVDTRSITAKPTDLYGHLRTLVNSESAEGYGYVYRVDTEEGHALLVMGHAKGKPMSGFLVTQIIDKRVIGEPISELAIEGFEIPNLFGESMKKRLIVTPDEARCPECGARPPSICKMSCDTQTYTTR